MHLYAYTYTHARVFLSQRHPNSAGTRERTRKERPKCIAFFVRYTFTQIRITSRFAKEVSLETRDFLWDYFFANEHSAFSVRYAFSTVSFIVIVQSKVSSELIFENFCMAIYLSCDCCDASCTRVSVVCLR